MGGGEDGVVVKFNPSLSSILWSTYLGGNNRDAAYSIKPGTNGYVYISGGTMSSNFTTTGGAFHQNYIGGSVDGFIVALSINNGSLYKSSFIGTNNYDQAHFVELDDKNNVYLLGQTLGNYPVSSGCYSNPGSPQFIHKLNSNLSASLFSTVFGNGNNNEVNISPSAFLVDKCDKIYVSGWGGSICASGSTTFGLHTTGSAFQSSTDGSDFYFMVLDRNATSLLYGSFFGGNGEIEHVDGGTSRFDKNGYIYQAVCAGCGGSNGFPTTPGVWSNTNNSFNCNLGAVKIKFDQTPVYAYCQVSPDTFSCVVPFVANFTNTSINATSHFWNFGAGQGTSTQANPNYTYTTPGTYSVMYIAINPLACNLRDTNYLTIVVNPPNPPVANFNYTVNCTTRQVQVTSTSSPAMQLSWNFGDGTPANTQSNVTHTYTTSGTYQITLVNEDALCQVADSMTKTITIKPMLDALMSSTDPTACLPSTVDFQSNAGAQSYQWNFGDGVTQTTNIPNTNHAYTTEGTFRPTVIVSDTNYCNIIDSSYMSVYTSDGSPVTADFNVTKNCSHQSVAIHNNSIGLSAFTTNFWTLDSNTSFYNNNPNINHTYGSYGLYTISLLVEDTICYISDTISRIVNLDLVEVNTTPTPPYGCRPFQTTFNTVSNGITYIWNFDDGSAGPNVQSPTHTFMNGGTYHVTVTAIDSNTCNISEEDQVTILVGSGLPLIADFDAVQDKHCGLHKISTENQSSGEITSYFWDFGDGSISHAESPSHHYSGSGYYTVSLYLEDSLCSFFDTSVQTIYIRPEIPFDLKSQGYLCHFDSFSVNTNLDPVLYPHLWSTGETTSGIVIKTPGFYWVLVTDGYCLRNDTIQIDDAPLYDLGKTIDQCYISETITLDIGIEAQEYLWANGVTTRTQQLEEPGIYPFYVLDLYGCEYRDTIILKEALSSYEVYVPNTFTPNGDRLNDVFSAEGIGLRYYDFKIFDRWGNLIFESSDIRNGWDGTYNNNLVQEDIYTYRLEYKNECTDYKSAVKYGSVMVLR